MNALEFLARFPVQQNVSTGGNCTAWQIGPFAGDLYILITAQDGDALQPRLADDRAIFGLYDGAECVRYSDDALTWEQGADFVRTAIAEQRDTVDPTAVTDWLSAALETWQDSQGLPRECAEEQLYTLRAHLTLDQKKWLRAFGALWEAQEAF